MTEQDFKNIIDNGSRVILEMTKELEKLEEKYGTASKFCQTKRFYLNCLIELHEGCVNEINALRNTLKMAMINNKAQELAMDLMAESFANNIHTDELAEQYLHLLKPTKA